MAGKGTEYMYISYKNKAEKYNPDITIMNIFIEDISRNGYGQDMFFHTQIKITDDKIQIKNNSIPTYEEFLKQYKPPKYESYFLKFISYKLEQIYNTNERQYSYGFKILSPILDELNKISKKFMVTIILPPESLNKGFSTSYDKYIFLKNMLDEKGISYFDGYNYFQEQSRQYNKTVEYFFNIEKGNHFNELGNAIFALGIKSKLKELNYLKSNLMEYNFSYIKDKKMLYIMDKENNIINKISSYKRENIITLKK